MLKLRDRLLSVSESPSRIYIEWLIFAIGVVLFCSLALFNQWFWRFNFIFYDDSIQTLSRAAPDDIVLLAIDDESISRVGHWPWPREIHTRAIQRLTTADARAVMFDVLFSETKRDNTAADEALAEAIRANGRVVLPIIHENTVRGPRERDPTPILAQAAAGIGHVHAEVDLDGIIRSTYFFEGLGELYQPHASLALLRLVNGDHDSSMLGESSADNLQRKKNLWQRQNWFHIPFFGPPGHFKTYSYARWITGEIPNDAVKNKIVFVGITATGLGDMHPTPVSGYFRPMPGVEIIMHVFEGLRSGINIRTLPSITNWSITVLLLMLLFFSFLRLRPGASVVISLFMILLGLLGPRFFLYYFERIIISMPFIICVIAAYPLWSWRRLALALRFLEYENKLLRHEAKNMMIASVEDHRVPFEPVSRSIKVLRETREQLELARRERESFLNFLSHDMRSPQTSILALLDMRQRGTSKLNDDEIFQKIQQYAIKTSSLADEFVQLAKAAQITPEAFSETELSSIVDETLDILWPQTSERHITFVRDYDQIAYIYGYAPLLQRAIFNLIHNAIKFTPENGKVVVSISDHDDSWRVAITDQGAGLTEEGKKQVLGLPNATQHLHDLGLIMGLALVRTVLERHDSTLMIDSEPGRGSTFSFLLAKFPA
ncbi:MAG: CHASE2 domain-containing protein [Burkholderiales bacterium]|jgi:CHASE2 domain-containing sensor protein/nitrogen-specific signal transduction histidine kinase|nr:CHASE2 domain-containing protein [Burkholderiales bacterium]